jgi:hypothetical protein
MRITLNSKYIHRLGILFQELYRLCTVRKYFVLTCYCFCLVDTILFRTYCILFIFVFRFINFLKSISIGYKNSYLKPLYPFAQHLGLEKGTDYRQKISAIFQAAEKIIHTFQAIMLFFLMF